MLKSPAARRYAKAIIILSLVYAVLLIGSVFAFKRDLLTAPLSYVVAVLPALPIIGMFAAIGRFLVEERDEYLRMLLVRQSLVASGFALAIATVWGFLESFDLAPHVDAYWFAVMWFAGLGVGQCVNAVIEHRGRA
ncbi:MAG TPA: hypothetical protein VF695_09605 [Sphingomonas sp.]|jgi:hypothetical protein